MNLPLQLYTEPLIGRRLEGLVVFLAAQGLTYDRGIGATVIIYDQKGAIAATGSLEKNVIKCVAIDEAYRGEGLMASLITALRSHAFTQGHSHLFVFTKPQNKGQFGDLGFFEIARTDEMLLMENKKDGIGSFLQTLNPGDKTGKIGAIVANCNPFTLGHLYLIEQAARCCDRLHIFILSEDRSLFSKEIRWDLAQKAVKHLTNVSVHPTSDYMVSSATFPTYFLKDQSRGAQASCDLDLEIFGKYVVPYFHISVRFVGEEPFSPVTAQYNLRMKEILPKFGVEVVEMPRKSQGNLGISASRVRQLMAVGDLEGAGRLVPPTTLEFLQSPQGRLLFKKEEING